MLLAIATLAFPQTSLGLNDLFFFILDDSDNFKTRELKNPTDVARKLEIYRRSGPIDERVIRSRYSLAAPSPHSPNSYSINEREIYPGYRQVENLDYMVAPSPSNGYYDYDNYYENHEGKISFSSGL